MLRVQNVEKPFGDSLFASRQTTAMTAVFHSFIILTEICQDLLLNPNCSISKILTFTVGSKTVAMFGHFGLIVMQCLTAWKLCLALVGWKKVLLLVLRP